MTSFLMLLGCSEGPTVAGVPERVAALCAPWSEQNLPVDGGTVVYCDPRRLTVEFPPGRADTLGPTWRLAVRTAGWAEDLDSSAPGLVNVRYVQENRRLDLSVVDADDHTLTILTELAP
jgi:hypothetical protein